MLSVWELICQEGHCSYDLSHMSWLRGNRVIILFPWVSYTKNTINVVSSGWLKAGSPRQKLKGRSPPQALSNQGLFNHCSKGICSQDLIKSHPQGQASMATFNPSTHFEGGEMPTARTTEYYPPGCDWTHQISSGHLQRYANRGSDTTGDVGNVFGGGTGRLQLTADALGNELQGLYAKHFKSLLFSI